MSLQRLQLATSVVSQETIYFERILDWQAKRECLVVQFHDLPGLLQGYKATHKQPHPSNPQITLFDATPRVRLLNACEALTNTLYGMSEIAAQFGNRVSGGKLPSSFNDMRKKVQKGAIDDAALRQALGDLQWYEKIREIRTEWAHHSTAFIGEDRGEPILVIRAYRRASDRYQFKAQVQCSVADIMSWASGALVTIDRFAEYLVQNHVLPKFNLDTTFSAIKYDAMGFPQMEDGGRIAVESMTIGAYFRRHGLLSGH